MAMYVDNILIYLSEPEQSIKLMVIGCTVNDVIKNKYAFHWDVERIKYLSINITKNLEDLYIKNYGELINQIKDDFKRWSPFRKELK
uniref:Uncharacterized protein n=1 Tax=Lates calcarifer TaxID=8187 RepID=A0A4W6FP49_LATCA